MNVGDVLGVVAMSTDLAIGLWPVTVFVGATGIAGAIALHRARRMLALQTLAVLGSFLVAAAAVPVYTLGFWADPAKYTPASQNLPLIVLGAFWILFFLTLGISVVLARGFRLPLAGVASLIGWFGAGMYLLSVMAVSGVWL